jgi:transaldolase
MTKIFTDGASLDQIAEAMRHPLVEGFTTNPTLMRKEGVRDYESFAKAALNIIEDKYPISFEVFADEPTEIVRQAKKISSWGSNVYVKIPVTTTKGELLYETIGSLSRDGIKVNVTAVFTKSQVASCIRYLYPGAPAYISVFAGRIADTGEDPVPIMERMQQQITSRTGVHTNIIELIWASPREVLNYIQAEAIGCDIITMTPELIAKIALFEKDHYQYSLETVQMFYNDAQAAGYTL